MGRLGPETTEAAHSTTTEATCSNKSDRNQTPIPSLLKAAAIRLALWGLLACQGGALVIRRFQGGCVMDFPTIAQEAHKQCEAVLSHWLPGGKREGSEYVTLNPTRADNSPGSFKVNLNTGKWADFADDSAKGGDLISLVGYIDGVNQTEAAKRLADFLGIHTGNTEHQKPHFLDHPKNHGLKNPQTWGRSSSTATNSQTHPKNGVPGVPGVPKDEKPVTARVSGQAARNTSRSTSRVLGVPSKEWRAIVPIPKDAPEPPTHHLKLGEPVATWCYLDTACNPACYVYRFNMADASKEFRPLTWCEHSGNGKRAWRWSALPEPRPLYNLHLLAAHPEATVIVCEGEKAADAAALLCLLPHFVTTTALNGCKSLNKADWAALAGRTVWLWADNDRAGRDGMADATVLIQQAGASFVGELRLEWFRRLPDGTERELPEKWDAADGVNEGYTAEHIAGFLSDPANILEHEAEISAECEARAEIESLNPGGSLYELIEWHEGYRNGVYFFGTDKNGERLPPKWVCSPLRVTAVTRSANQDSWGRLLEWDDRDRSNHYWAAPVAMTIGDGVEFCKELADQGLEIEPGAKSREHLIRYVTLAKPEAQARCTERTGWQGGLFVLPHKTIGQAPERVIFQSAAGASSAFRERGTLAEWRDGVAALCRGNSRLLFVLSAAFASVLLELIGDESGGFHLIGASSEGKSSALFAAASVFGGHDYKRQWNATVNGVEAVAATHSGALLILDELVQCDPRAVGEAAYLLANGCGKQRANRSGGARHRQSWRVLFLSAGEIDLAQHMRDGGKKIRAGQEVRLLTIPANPGTGHGIYEALHGFVGGAALSKAISERAREWYGTAGIAFIEAVANNLEAVPGIIKQLRLGFLAEHLPRDATGQADRAAERFALCAVAGEMATRFGITGWEPGEAAAGVAACFRAWMEHRGGAGNQEAAAMLAQIRGHFEAHGEARYANWEHADKHPIIRDRAGLRKSNSTGGWDYYVLPETFKAELCAGFEHRAVAQLLTERGILTPDKAGKSAQSLTLPGIGKARAYVIDGERLWGDA